MHLSTIISLAVLLGSTAALPRPDNGSTPPLVARVGNNDGQTYASAIDVRFDAAGWEEVANAMAYALLCHPDQAPRTMQRLVQEDLAERKKAKQAHYRSSGAAARPYKAEGVKKYHLRKPKIEVTKKDFATAEEVPPESSNILNESSRRAVLMPTPHDEQIVQGAKMTAALKRYGVGNGQWYHIVAFDNCNRAYCVAFNNNDRSVCFKKLKEPELDPDEYAVMKISLPGQTTEFGFANLKQWDPPSGSKRSNSDEISDVDVPANSARRPQEDQLIKRGDLVDQYEESEFASMDLPAEA